MIVSTISQENMVFLFKSRRFFTSTYFLTLHKSQISFCLEHVSHLWRMASKHSLATLPKIHKCAFFDPINKSFHHFSFFKIFKTHSKFWGFGNFYPEQMVWTRKLKLGIMLKLIKINLRAKFQPICYNHFAYKYFFLNFCICNLKFKHFVTRMNVLWAWVLVLVRPSKEKVISKMFSPRFRFLNTTNQKKKIFERI